MVLPKLQQIALPGSGPEDVVMDFQGNVRTGLADGRLLSINPRSGAIRTLSRTGGRPLGLAMAADGGLWVCDSPQGLLYLHPKHHTLNVVINRAFGEPLPFCSNVVVGRSGTVYFSTSSRRYPVQQFHRDIVENIPTGAVYSLNVQGQLTLLMDGLAFANGLVLDAEENSLIVAETAALRLRRYWLGGPQQGQQEVWKSLPAMPDNMALGTDGLIWVALVTTPPAALRLLWSLPRQSRQWLGRLPPALSPSADRWLWVQAYDQHGRLCHDFCWKNNDLNQATGVCEQEGRLYIGSLYGHCVAWCQIS